MILKAKAEKGSLSAGLRVIVSPVSGLMPLVSLASSGEGRIIHYRVEQGLDAFVLKRGAHHHREKL